MTIEAKVIADSVNKDGIRLTTLQLKYPRFIHAEFMTHRMFSRNASSSRAIPIEKLIDRIIEDPAMPVYWGSNKSGMQAGDEIENVEEAISWWKDARLKAAEIANKGIELGLHKQIVNRITEPFQHINVIVTATEWKNFFKLRLHPDAQPEIQALAKAMKEAIDESVPFSGGVYEEYYHTPYVKLGDDGIDSLEDAIKCSVARCARVSYLNHDQSKPSKEKDLKLYEKLYEAGHMSPFEHIATPMKASYLTDQVGDIDEKGITHVDRNLNIWSGNFMGWIQYRQML